MFAFLSATKSMEVVLHKLTGSRDSGIPLSFASKHRSERFNAVGDLLAKGDYDIAVLEEVWSTGDFKKLVSKTNATLPYSYYFHSGFIGAGLCIFSKGRIIDTIMHRYSLNGYAHKVQHGDWFGGKCLGMCVIEMERLRIHVYATHLHAQYSIDNDEYISHRVVQAFETAQFIRATRQSADVCILAGDLNLEPSHVGYKLIRYHGNLKDTWLESENKIDDSHEIKGHTCDAAHNTYTVQGAPPVRIDHIMYSCKKRLPARCLDCQLPLDKIPGHTISYSDHEAVVAVLAVGDSDECSGDGEQTNSEEQILALKEAIQIMNDGIKQVQRNRWFFGGMALVVAVFLFLSVELPVPYGTQNVIGLIRVLFTIGMGYCTWMAAVESRKEQVSMIGAKKGMEISLDSAIQNIDAF